jgi:citrate synthase
MAIPHWTWPDSETDATTAAALEAATSAFDVLSDPTRATILGALYDADGPLSYSAVADAAGVEDNGRLNYHLRELGGLVDRSGTLPRCRRTRVLRTVFTAAALARIDASRRTEGQPWLRPNRRRSVPTRRQQTPVATRTSP